MGQAPSTVAATPGFDQLQPKMTASGNGGRLVTLAMGWRQPLPDAPTELRHVSFEPWDAWPGGTIFDPYLADFDRGVSFAIAPTPGDEFALLMTTDNFPPPADMRFVRNMVPYSPSIDALTAVPGGSDQALFVGLLHQQHLLGYALPSFNRESRMRIADLTINGTVLGPPIALGCASDELTADVASGTTGWLVAASSAGPVPDPCLVDGPAGPASRVALARVFSDGSAIPLSDYAAYADTNVRALQIQLIPHADGGYWLVHSAEVPGTPVFASLLDHNANVLVGPIDLALNVNEGFAAADLDGRLVIVWLGSAPSFEVDLYDQQLQHLGHSSVAIDATGITSGRPTVVASPAGDSIVVAASHRTTESRVRVMRLDCLEFP
jgi:hypothetical protein